ncbi:MAG: ABC transporter permease subunit [Verrucomicrobiota bacterium]|nr:ABC transporter permease subunit [Verrucomicrobiota bacterium]
MNIFRALIRRELSMFFQGPTGFIIISAVLFLISLGFLVVLYGLNGEATPMPVTQIFYETYFFWLILLLIAPAITMRSFAMERASGTYESLMTAPVGDWQVVLSKFTGALIFYMILWTPLLVCSIVVRFYVGESAVLGFGTMFTTSMGILMIGSLYVSIGCFASALTQNQAVAAVGSFAIGAALFFTGFFSYFSGDRTDFFSLLARHISLANHMESFTRGILDLGAIIFFLSLTSLFLYLTHKVVESRRWK